MILMSNEGTVKLCYKYLNNSPWCLHYFSPFVETFTMLNWLVFLFFPPFQHLGPFYYSLSSLPPSISHEWIYLSLLQLSACFLPPTPPVDGVSLTHWYPLHQLPTLSSHTVMSIRWRKEYAHGYMYITYVKQRMPTNASRTLLYFEDSRYTYRPWIFSIQKRMIPRGFVWHFD